MSTQRRAFILVFVLGVTTVVTALGLSYISSNGTVMQQAANRYAAVRAQYIAESGAVLASHYVHFPPKNQAYNVVYAGDTNVAIDNSKDTVDITVTPSTPANRYVIQASATARNQAGTVELGKQSITCEAIIPPEPKWNIAQAVLMTGGATISSGVDIGGAGVHSNGSLVGQGTCNKAVSATGAAVWTGGGPPSSVQSLASAVAAPPVNVSLYSSYKVNNTAYTAYSWTTALNLGIAEFAALKSVLDASDNTTNPGRIVLLPLGDAKIKETVNFTGTLVVRGDLRLEAPNIKLNAVKDYPAVVAAGDIFTSADYATVTFTGPVLCSGRVKDGGNDYTKISTKGPLICGSSISCTGFGSSIDLNWQSDRCLFWDFTKTANPVPFTSLEWREN